MKDSLRRLYGHFTTITKHRHQVMIHCFKAGIPLQGLAHDLSKYMPEEFIPGIKYFAGDHSPNEGERIDKGYSRAWMHHKGRNKHHFEYWTDHNPKTKVYEPVPMPMRYVIEMFCDRVAASRTYNGDNYTDAMPLEYLYRSKEYKLMHPETKKRLEKLLRMLRDKGEDATFDFIKEHLLKRKN